MNIILAILLLFNMNIGSGVIEEDRYVIQTMSSHDKGDYIGLIIHDELDKAIEDSGMYKLPGEGRVPDLKIILSTKWIKNVFDEEKNENPTIAISIAFVLLPKKINYHAFSYCDVSDINGTKSAVEIIMKFINIVYENKYLDAKFIADKIKID